MAKRSISYLPVIMGVMLSGCSLFASDQGPGTDPVAASVKPQAGLLSTDAPAAQQAPGTGISEDRSPEVVTSAPVQPGLQLGAFSSALSAGQHLQSMRLRFPLMFEGREPIIRTKSVNGQTLYRIVLGPFASKQLTREFCQQLRAQGEGCFPTDYDRVQLRSGAEQEEAS